MADQFDTTDIWGRPRQSSWWNQDVSDASQALYGDPMLAMQSATLPAQLLAAQQAQEQAEQQARDDRSGFLNNVLGGLKGIGKSIDGVLSNVKGWGIVKDASAGAGKILWWPVDKVASGAYWLYSEAVSQPLSTLFIQSGKAEVDGWSNFFSGSEWSDAYGQAEDISPAQAYFNASAVEAATGSGIKIPTLMDTGITEADKQEVKNNAERFIYDTEYWRDKQGWKYTVGTGTLDFFFSMAADPAYAGVSAVSKGIKGARATTLTTAAAERQPRFQSISGKFGDYVGGKIAPAAKTPEAAVQSNALNDFFDWAADGTKLFDDAGNEIGKANKTGYEIAQHPIFGSGRRRRNPEADSIAEFLSKTPRDAMGESMRFAGGDVKAIAPVLAQSEVAAAALGKASDNRTLVDSLKFDKDTFGYFLGEEAAGRAAASAGGTSAGVTQRGILAEAPFPKPTAAQGATPAQIAGWEATYGRLEERAQFYREAARAVAGKSSVPVLPGPGAAKKADIANAKAWKAAKVKQMADDLDELTVTDRVYQMALGGIEKNIDDFSAAKSNVFGTVSSFYRTGPLALKSQAALGDRAVAKAAAGRGDRLANANDGGIAIRTIRNGFYTPVVRVVNSFGQRLPGGFVDHNAADAPERVMDMLKQVRGLTPEERLNLLRQYSQAGDKIRRGEALKVVNQAVIEHLASRVNNLDPLVGSKLAKIIDIGITQTMDELRGVKVPRTTGTQQRFTAATDQKGKYLDRVEDDGGYVIAPTAKTQLSTSDVLLPIRELDRIITRNSGYMQTLRRGGWQSKDVATEILDAVGNTWKAATLLRPGYTLRSMSEEQVASAIKFGILSTLADSAHGGWNLIRNSQIRVKAYTGKGSFVPTSGRGADSFLARLNITDPSVVAAAEKRAAELQTKIAAEADPLKRAVLQKDLEATKVANVKVSNAYPIAQARISQEVSERAAARDTHKALSDKLANWTAKYPNPTKVRTQKMADIRRQLADLDARIKDHDDVIEEFSDYSDEMLRVAQDARGLRLGEGTQEINGIKVPEYFSREWINPIPRDQITSAHAMSTIFARSESVDRGRIIKTGDWVAVAPHEPHHMESWTRGLNLQFGQDDLYRLVMEDPTLKKARDWLKTPAGRTHRAALGPGGRNAENLIKTVTGTLDQYLPESTGLRQKLLNGDEITETDLRKAIRQEDFPMVHGEDFKVAIPDRQWERANAIVDRAIETGFNRLGTIPNDILARQPIFLRAYQARMQQFLEQEIGLRASQGKSTDHIDLADLENVRDKAARFAKKDISQVVYDPERTNATEALRFFAPFMSAHVDGLQRWAGLVAEKPQFVTQAAKIYNAPVAANLVTDENGNHVGQDGYADIIDPTTGKVTGREFVPLEKRIITFHLPGQQTKVKGAGNVPVGGVPIRISALNTILPGDPWFNPGAGPYVQAAGSAVAKEVPEVGDFLQWAKVLPYGPSESFGASFTPKYMKDAWNAFTAGDQGNEKYQAAFLAEWQRQSADHANGGPEVDMDLVKKNAKQFMFMEALTAWASPVQTNSTPLTGSPYQFFLDQYRTMQETDPKNAQTLFMAKYGSDYFAFTASLNKSMGIASTLSADKTAEKYGDLIAADPDLASLIVGDVYNKGDFSMAVYRKQMDELIGGKRVREKISAEDAIRENEKDLGWQQYGKLTTALDAMLIRSGYRSYSQAGAQKLNDIKQTFVQEYGKSNKAWLEDYGNTQTKQVPLRIDAMRKIVKDEDLLRDDFRGDIRTLAQYIQVRDILQATLRRAGGRSLSFDVQGNPTGQYAALGAQLREYQTLFINSDTRFGDVFHRYLEGDDLS